MILDKRVFLLSLIYSFITVFFIVVLIIPFRVVYDYMNLGYSYYLPDTSSFLLVAENLRIIMSRGFIPFIIGMILFIISMILFLKFSDNGNSMYAKVGYIFGVISGSLLILSVVINYFVYSNRFFSLTPLLITLAMGLTELNIGTLIFTKRNDLELYVTKFKKISEYVKEKRYAKPVRKEAVFPKDVKPTKPLPKEGEIFCPSCGTKVERDHKFCRKCGSSLNKKIL